MATSGDGGLSDTEQHQPTHTSSHAAAAAAAALAAEEEAQRISLLDVIIEEYNQEKAGRTSRMLLIGEIDTDKIDALKKFHADYLDSPSIKEGEVTGVLFVLHNPVLPSQAVILHLVEAPTKVLVELMRNLAEVSGWALPGTGPMNLSTAAASGAPLGKSLTSPSASPNSHMIRVEPRNQPLMRSAVLLSFTEEVPREFRFWAFRAHVKMPSDDFISSTLGANLQRDALKLCFETLKNMLELGREVGTMSVEKAIEFIQGPENLAPTLAPPLPKQVANKLPSAERLLAYIHQLPDLCSIQEWLEIYDTPIDFTLENEKVWPVEPFLKY